MKSIGIKVSTEDLYSVLPDLKEETSKFEGISIRLDNIYRRSELEFALTNFKNGSIEKPSGAAFKKVQSKIIDLIDSNIEYSLNDLKNENVKLQFYNKNRPLEFAFFSIEEFKILCKMSNNLTFTGVSIDFGEASASLNDDNRYSDIFTLNVKGDYKKLEEEKGGWFRRVLDKIKRLKWVDEENLKPKILLALPCPPHWYTDDIVLFNLMAKLMKKNS